MNNNKEEELKAHSLTLTEKQAEILGYIKKHGVIVLERAYLEMQISKPNLGRYLQDLERKGLIETIPIGDGRTKPKKLTNLGRKVVDEKKLGGIDKITQTAMLDAIVSAAEKMAMSIVGSKRGPKKSNEEELKEITELTEIKKLVIVLKRELYLITNEEKFKLLEEIDSR